MGCDEEGGIEGLVRGRRQGERVCSEQRLFSRGEERADSGEYRGVGLGIVGEV